MAFSGKVRVTDQTGDGTVSRVIWRHNGLPGTGGAYKPDVSGLDHRPFSDAFVSELFLEPGVGRTSTARRTSMSIAATANWSVATVFSMPRIVSVAVHKLFDDASSPGSRHR